MQNNFTRIKDLFTEYFFVKLKSFILDKCFNDFYERRIPLFRNYAGYDEGIWAPIEEDMSNSDIYPISF